MPQARLALVLLAFAVTAAPVLGQEPAGRVDVPEVDPGLRDYAEACARCHGISGKGDGIVAPFLRVPPPDLTAIQRTNGGVFPGGVIYEVIEGGGSTSAHGTREMPAWGTRFADDEAAAPGMGGDPGAGEAALRARIEALVAFIAALQEP